jgi:adenylate cyclase
MERNETGRLDALRDVRQRDVAQFVIRFNGRIIKLMGDGLLVEFGSVVNAVHAAIEIQRAASGRNTGRAEDEFIDG